MSPPAGEGRSARLYFGDCLESMRAMPAESVDAVVCDPPYGLSSYPDMVEVLQHWLAGDDYTHGGSGFMGKTWDSFVPGPSVWREALRVLKPGGYLLAFASTRTQDLMGTAIRLAGFEIRDSLIWQYGSGFPKSLDVSKAIDKIDRAEASEARARTFTAWMRSTGITAAQINEATGSFMGSHYLTDKQQPAVATADLFDLLRPLFPPVPEEIEELVRSRTVESENMKRREVLVERTMMQGGGTSLEIRMGERREVQANITAPATDAAKAWKGWGTALKPAFEPVVVARKPLEGTVAGNVLKHGTGALNIDGCRVGYAPGEVDFDRVQRQQHSEGAVTGAFGAASLIGTEIQTYKPGGRWPANVLFTHAPGCVRVGLQKVKSQSTTKYSSDGQGMGGAHGIYSALGARPAGVELGYADADGTETVAAYECAPGCPVAALDAQSGQLPVSRGGGNGYACSIFGTDTQKTRAKGVVGFGDIGGASRFFTVTEYGDDDLPGAKPGDPPFYYASKASRSEREAGCGDLPARSGAEAVDRDEGSAGAQSPRAGAGRTASEVRNFHPTVKPLSVMRWLCRLVTPPGGIVLDPFMGSGTTGVAALLEGFDFVGCEREADYLLIAEARIAHHAPGARLLGPGDE